MSKLECYAVFEGGGVKGSAFAGALVSAEKAGINFVGYGGASVGSIIAFLSCLGFSSQELEFKIKSLDLSEFLDKKIVNETHLLQEIFNNENYPEKIKFKNLLIDLDGISKKYNFLKWIPGVYFRLLLLKRLLALNSIKSMMKLLYRLIRNYGIHSKDDMVDVLIKYASEKIEDNEFRIVNGKKSLSFKRFFEITGKDLRVVATNLNSKRAVKFSHIHTPDFCVFQAVAASSSFPFFYEPSIIDGSYLIDGGVSCNLPSFLFANEIHKRLPIYAFDLIVEEGHSNNNKFKSLLSYSWRILTSLLDASTEIISEEVGCIVVPVKIPKGINTLNFNLTPKQINDLFKSGKDSAQYFFEHHKMTLLASDANDSHRIGSLIYGVFDEALIDLTWNVSFNNKIVKAWLYTSINSDPKEIISFSVGSNDNNYPEHHSFKLNEVNNDCVECWKEKNLKYIYDEVAGKIRICFPVMKYISEDEYFISDSDSESPILAVLCISTICNPEDCEWLTFSETTGEFDIAQDYVIMIKNYVKIISMAMLGNQLIFHEKMHVEV